MHGVVHPSSQVCLGSVAVPSGLAVGLQPPVQIAVGTLGCPHTQPPRQPLQRHLPAGRQVVVFRPVSAKFISPVPGACRPPENGLAGISHQEIPARRADWRGRAPAPRLWRGRPVGPREGACARLSGARRVGLGFPRTTWRTSLSARACRLGRMNMPTPTSGSRPRL
jgi:hypothetical protein